MAKVFDGKVFAASKEIILKKEVKALPFTPRLMSIVFVEDKAGDTYTDLKFEVATRIGIEFDRLNVSLDEPLDALIKKIQSASQRPDLHGLLIQKPAKAIWQQFQPITYNSSPITFPDWWHQLTSQIDLLKDVDCLHPQNLAKVYQATWTLLPATVKAILYVLLQALDESALPSIPRNLDARELLIAVKPFFTGKKISVVGRSDIVGRPLAAVCSQAGGEVNLLGSIDSLSTTLLSSEIIISATGVANLITEALVKPGAVVIDVGYPVGDLDFERVKSVAGFITPVPFGIGPVTVTSLLENLVQVVVQKHPR
ncbi:hypothetical protein A3A66_02655 [Microgenomates group bacterium RIFCSPLOWO2_01_FULL_46_13]|nr:MAG: hypothetical protein A2783_03090 [Microgenomates group bacterium RIFCSPHIGHO2_01_FULL_45_11]OGV94871.1 MAG: hypothetical protein A3A66_02655 [Microgenomates group bacterium RIFCSPLOWO2_01_FULL_46_13]